MADCGSSVKVFSLSSPNAVRRMVYQAVTPPRGGESNTGNSGSLAASDNQTSASRGFRTMARAKLTISAAPLATASTACSRLSNPPVNISGTSVTLFARRANSRKYLITHNSHPDSDTMGHRLPGIAGFQPAASSRKRRYEHRLRAGSPRSQEDRCPGKPTGPG